MPSHPRADRAPSGLGRGAIVGARLRAESTRLACRLLAITVELRDCRERVAGAMAQRRQQQWRHALLALRPERGGLSGRPRSLEDSRTHMHMRLSRCQGAYFTVLCQANFSMGEGLLYAEKYADHCFSGALGEPESARSVGRAKTSPGITTERVSEHVRRSPGPRGLGDISLGGRGGAPL